MWACEKEYLRIREEAESVKICMTDYVKFLVLGIGVAFYAWGNSVVTVAPEKLWIIALSAFCIAVISGLLLLVLIYKFISHNRYVGYCQALSLEDWKGGQLNDRQVFRS